MNQQPGLLIALEGGGTRSQAVLMDHNSQVIQQFESSPVNINFVSLEAALQAVLTAVRGVLQSAGVSGHEVSDLVSSLVGAQFGLETFREICPLAHYRTYNEMRVVFARAGIYRPHGVGVVAATGATTWGVRADDGREVYLGGWGSLLGDEGSAYAMGLLGLRASARAYQHRAPAPTDLVDAICQHFGLSKENYSQELIYLAYRKPLSRTEIAGVARVVTRLADQGDKMALLIVSKVANDLTELALNTARRLFNKNEVFDVVVAGGLVNGGEHILGPIRKKLNEEFPQAIFQIGTEEPAMALGRLALYEINEKIC